MKLKETFGVEVGDKITCHWEDWSSHVIRNKKVTGIVIEVDHCTHESDAWATFRFKNYKGIDCWFCGEPTKIVKPNQTP